MGIEESVNHPTRNIEDKYKPRGFIAELYHCGSRLSEMVRVSFPALDPDLGRYSWRRWRTTWTPPVQGVYQCMVRATNKAGVSQLHSQWNRGGYQRSLIEHMDVRAI